MRRFNNLFFVSVLIIFLTSPVNTLFASELYHELGKEWKKDEVKRGKYGIRQCNTGGCGKKPQGSTTQDSGGGGDNQPDVTDCILEDKIARCMDGVTECRNKVAKNSSEKLFETFFYKKNSNLSTDDFECYGKDTYSDIMNCCGEIEDDPVDQKLIDCQIKKKEWDKTYCNIGDTVKECKRNLTRKQRECRQKEEEYGLDESGICKEFRDCEDYSEEELNDTTQPASAECIEKAENDYQTFVDNKGVNYSADDLCRVEKPACRENEEGDEICSDENFVCEGGTEIDEYGNERCKESWVEGTLDEQVETSCTDPFAAAEKEVSGKCDEMEKECEALTCD